MAKRSHNMLTAVLGTVAMLLALILAPIAAGATGGGLAVKTAAVAKAAGSAHSAHAAHALPCHTHSPKPCPHCPQKLDCADAITCMAKCAQTLAVAPLEYAQPMPMVWLSIAAPASAAAPVDHLIPPLLRPPIA